jgi:hypothetical protein
MVSLGGLTPTILEVLRTYYHSSFASIMVSAVRYSDRSMSYGGQLAEPVTGGVMDCVASPATTNYPFRLRQINPTSKSLLIFRNNVKTRNQKYFA